MVSYSDKSYYLYEQDWNDLHLANLLWTTGNAVLVTYLFSMRITTALLKQLNVRSSTSTKMNGDPAHANQIQRPMGVPAPGENNARDPTYVPQADLSAPLNNPHINSVRFTVNNVHKELVNFTRHTQESQVDGIVACAPHTVRLLNGVILATGYQCIVVSKIIAGTDHVINVAGFSEESDLVKVVLQSMVNLGVSKKYEVNILHPMDYHNKVAYISILVAVYTTLKEHEPKIALQVEEVDVPDGIRLALKKTNVEMPFRNTILAACMEGSLESIHVEAKGADGYDHRTSSKIMYNSSSLKFVRSDSIVADTTSRERVDLRQKFLDTNESGELGRLMIEMSEKRRGKPREWKDDYERALSALYESGVILGYDIQNIGAFVLCKKRDNQDQVDLDIATEIAKATKGQIKTVTIDQVTQSNGASVVDEDTDWRQFGDCSRTVFEFAELQIPAPHPVPVVGLAPAIAPARAPARSRARAQSQAPAPTSALGPRQAKMRRLN